MMERALDSIPTRRAEPKRVSHGPASFERVMLVGGVGDARRLERMTRHWIPGDAWVRAASLEEALVLLSQHSYDVILTDWYLPDCPGHDPVARLRRVSAQTPIIVLTSLEDLEISEQALKAGAQDVLFKKELDGKQLLRAMRHSRERQSAQAQLQHGALHDELTSLAKRTLLSQRIANALARSRRSGNTFALIYIDLDHFKSINDTHGHDVGDAVLVAVSHRLKAAVREYDTVARLGGDEFAILLDTLEDAAEAEVVAQRVLQSLAPPVRVDCHDVGVTASMGISVFPEGGDAADTLLRSADLAMYSAKRAGRNTYSLTPLAEHTGLLPVEGEPTVSLQCSSRR
jgi:diguanylate cyclase (GGDEF)-like protein